ncbi:MAG TPA: CPXCG motif-containing cysteine-rich protein [Nitrospiria bacterium]|nr:CPXCG motif-containing cysteine-rich protein [Nitrospiria bacterium]
MGYCGQTNEILIDESIGKSHEVIEDCYVCCKPNVVHNIREYGRWNCWATPEN